MEGVKDGVTQVIFIAPEDFSSELCSCGVYVIRKPFGVNMFKVTLQMVGVAFNRMKMLYNKNNKLMQKIEEIKLINRAKAILIKTFGMSEDEAHRYMERQAMDLRKTKVYVAEKILGTYEM